MDLEVLQFQHRAWAKENFPNQTLEEAFMGVVEEVGELSHCLLKRKQGIRGYDNDEKFYPEAADAIGDIVIFLDGVCMLLGLDFPSVVKETWHEVMKRDWINNPKGDGV